MRAGKEPLVIYQPAREVALAMVVANRQQAEEANACAMKVILAHHVPIVRVTNPPSRCTFEATYHIILVW